MKVTGLDEYGGDNMDEFSRERLLRTGYHIEYVDENTPYQKYLARANSLLAEINSGNITTEQYRWEIQLLMEEYRDEIREHILSTKGSD